MPTDAQIQVLLDKQEIRDVLMTYCRAIDRVDRELLASVYHPDADDDHGPLKGKMVDLIEGIFEGLERLSTTSFHSLSNILVDVDGDVAHSESYVTACHTATSEQKGKYVWIFAGRYIDRFERRGGVWKIANRRTVMDWEYITPPVEESLFEDGPFLRGLRSQKDLAYER